MLSGSYVLGNCDDFKKEKGAMEELVQSKGHIVIFSPKGHPEIDGAGIEFDWGVSKKIFRRENNHEPKHSERDVRSSLQKVSLTIAYHTSRKVRSYMKAYVSDSGESQLLIEKFVKIHKCHRNILDQETSYFGTLKILVEGHINELKKERDSLLEEKRQSEIKKEQSEIKKEN